MHFRSGLLDRSLSQNRTWREVIATNEVEEVRVRSFRKFWHDLHLAHVMMLTRVPLQALAEYFHRGAWDLLDQWEQETLRSYLLGMASVCALDTEDSTLRTYVIGIVQDGYTLTEFPQEMSDPVFLEKFHEEDLFLAKRFASLEEYHDWLFEIPMSSLAHTPELLFAYADACNRLAHWGHMRGRAGWRAECRRIDFS